jgi:Sigma-70 region 2
VPLTIAQSQSKVLEPLERFAVIPREGIADGVRKTRPNEELSDGELLQLSSKGNEDAFLILFRRHEGPVFRFALHMSGRRETAEEVTQEVFLTLLSDQKLYAEGRGALQGVSHRSGTKQGATPPYASSSIRLRSIDSVQQVRS